MQDVGWDSCLWWWYRTIPVYPRIFPARHAGGYGRSAGGSLSARRSGESGTQVKSIMNFKVTNKNFGKWVFHVFLNPDLENKCLICSCWFLPVGFSCVPQWHCSWARLSEERGGLQLRRTSPASDASAAAPGLQYDEKNLSFTIEFIGNMYEYLRCSLLDIIGSSCCGYSFHSTGDVFS